LVTVLVAGKKRYRADTGLKRVDTHGWTLRTLGWKGVLVTRGDGYLLDPRAAVAWGLV